MASHILNLVAAIDWRSTPLCCGMHDHLLDLGSVLAILTRREGQLHGADDLTIFFGNQE